jgi:peptidyl-prolyl cis-trans isomerase C
MKLSGKVIAAIVVVFVLGGALIWGQLLASKSKKLVLTAQDMEVLVGQVLPPAQQAQFASDPEKRKELAKNLKQILAVGRAAEQEGYADRPDIKSQLSFEVDKSLRAAYQKKNPDFKVSDEDVAAYNQQHPDEFRSFLEANPNFKAQAQGAQAEQMKQIFGQIKVMAERARREGLDSDKATELQILLSRNQLLAQAYFEDLQKNSDKLVTDADVEEYYNSHPEEFEEVRARHILVSTKPTTSDADEGDDKGGKKEPKSLSKEEARKKAQALLDRVHKGEDFARLAQENSDDPGSKVKGGDLGYFSRGMMVGQFQDTAFKMKPGETSEVIETDYGFHIIRVEDRRTSQASDPQTRQKITAKVQQDKLKNKIDEITAKSNVEVADDFQLPGAAQAGEAPAAASVPHGGK